eukprot:CAMPEP_0202923282 /NCGR_PEP_ID=MMETSP1392-20130828/78368_1 /ASSEMBLY_ACC=CAM_ASM_000868 /TAXON_ID=225041 /ORGANISM="Chlamydomonas chlamydogama, Strain SAG 11-48b" /LENGTH=438 /DNA_ID=CAMNT_0049616959 /DNA_START=27 /DNA_END=1343 /DNA_ORIENTATION=-
MALFRRTDQAAGKKVVVNVRSMMGMGSEQLLGKLRIRLSTLQAGVLHTAELPLRGERNQSRVGPVVGRATLSIMVVHPRLGALLNSYFEPHVYPPAIVLSLGCAAGDDLTSPFAGNPALAVPEEVLARRARKVVLGWLDSGCAPGIPLRTARRLLDDGRQEFTLSRTQQNWRRVMAVIAAVRPLQEWWRQVQSWRNPVLSTAVACGTMFWAVHPAQMSALLLLAFAAYLYYLKSNVLGEAVGQPAPMVDDLPAEPDDQASASAAVSGATEVTSPPASGTQTPLLASGPGGASFSSLPGSQQQAAPPQSSAASTLASLFGVGGGGAAVSSVVPLDTFNSLKSQYDSVVGFLSTIQNVLDGVATVLERLQALLTWQDPTATYMLLLSLTATAAAIWLLGMPALIAASVLYDMRPPLFRDPLPTGGQNMFGHLPSRGDRMM